TTWIFGGHTVTLRQNSTLPPEMGMGGKEKRNPAQVDFPGFEWISAQNYTAIEKVLGRECIIFRGQSGSNNPDESSFAAVASVDTETRLPMSLVIADETRIYQYGPAPQAVLVPPAKVLETVNAWQKHLQN